MPVDRFELPEEKQELLGERIKAFNNLAQGQMKIEAWDAALAALGNVLKVEVMGNLIGNAIITLPIFFIIPNE